MLSFSNHNMLQNDKYCKLYLPFKNSVTDEQSRGKSETHTITNNGSVAITTVGGKQCAGFNGTDQYLSIPSSADWIMKRVSVSLEIYILAIPSDGYFDFILRQATTSLDGAANMAIRLQPNGIISTGFNIGSGVNVVSPSSIVTINNWYYVYVNISDYLELYVNGIKVASEVIIGDYNTSDKELIIGTAKDSSIITQSCFNGYVRNLSIHKGIARYNRNFTPQDRLI